VKFSLITLLGAVTLNAAQSGVYQTSLYTGTLFLFLLLLGIVLVQMRRASQDRKLLMQKEEKLERIREQCAQKEQLLLSQIQELEKEKIELNFTIESLQVKLKEGTKNQVVSKLEALRRARRNVQEED